MLNVVLEVFKPLGVWLWENFLQPLGEWTGGVIISAMETDWCDSKIALAAEGLSASIDEIYELVEKKLEPLIDKIQQEFHETEEFKTHEKHEKITTIYAAKKAQFNENIP